MNTFKLIRLALYVASALLIVNAARLVIAPTSASAVVVPFTAVLAETIIGPDGQRRAGPTQTWATRSDGSVAVSLGGVESGTRQIRFASGIHVHLHDNLRAKSTTQRSTEDSWLLQPESSCEQTLTGVSRHRPGSGPAIDRVGGYRAARFNEGLRTWWYALDHGCALIKRRTAATDLGSNELDLVALLPGEPGDRLFEVPQDYMEGPPSSFARSSYSKSCDAACQESQRAHFERLDRSYDGHRIR